MGPAQGTGTRFARSGSYIDAVLLVQALLGSAALLLVVAGVTKLRSPHLAVRAARALSLPATPGSIRVLALVEVVVGVATILTASALARVALGLLYGAFLVFVIAAIARRAPISSCGCFGEHDAPPSLVHVAINACATAVGFVAVADGIDAPVDAMSDSAVDALVVGLGAVALTVAAGAVLSGRLGSRSKEPRPDAWR